MPPYWGMPRLFLFLLVGLGFVISAMADQVELTDGSILKGRITAIEGGKLRIETTYTGTLTLELAHVKTFATDEPVNASIGGMPPALAPVAATETGIRVTGAGGVREAAPAEITALWRQGAESPGEKIARERDEKRRRKWAYEATVAVTGRTGAAEKLNATVGGKATLASDHDRLVLAVIAERAEDTGVETSNRQFAGADYSWFYSPDHGWYVRTSVEADRIKSLDLRSASAFGLTRKVVHTDRENLELRAGASYTYEAYSDDTDLNSPGLDFTLINSFTHANSKLNTILAYIPSFRDASIYRVRHESNLEIPLTAALWKLKIGLANEYQNVPPAGVDRFDTTYFTSLLLNWK